MFFAKPPPSKRTASNFCLLSVFQFFFKLFKYLLIFLNLVLEALLFLKSLLELIEYFLSAPLIKLDINIYKDILLKKVYFVIQLKFIYLILLFLFMKILDFQNFVRHMNMTGNSVGSCVYLLWHWNKEGLIINQAKTSKSRGTSVKHIEITAKIRFKVDSKEIDIPDIKIYWQNTCYTFVAGLEGRKNLDWKKIGMMGIMLLQSVTIKKNIFRRSLYIWTTFWIWRAKEKMAWGFAKGKVHQSRNSNFWKLPNLILKKNSYELN